MSEITITIDEDQIDELVDLLATFDSLISTEQKNLKHRILHTYSTVQSAREDVKTKEKRCNCCHRINVQFYTDKEGNESKTCKTCETANLNLFHPEWSFLFEKYDIPLIYSQWFGTIENLLDKHFIKELQLEPQKVFGRYLAKMKLLGYKSYDYQDSDMLNKLEEE